MEIIKILADDNLYKNWVIEEELEQHFNISLCSNRAIISAIGKNKIYIKDGKMYSDIPKSIESKFPFAFAAFRTINMD